MILRLLGVYNLIILILIAAMTFKEKLSKENIMVLVVISPMFLFNLLNLIK